MQLTLLKGYPDYIGKRFAFVGFGSGPASYVNTGTAATSGDPLVFPAYGRYIDSIADTHSLSGTYIVSARPSLVGNRPTWKLAWFVAATGLEVANGVTTLAAESVQIMGFGGDY